MLLKFGLALLFFLPVIESFNRPFAYSLLLIGSLLISANLFWKKRISLDYIDNLFLILLALFSLSTIFSWSIIRSFTELLRYFAYFLVFMTVKNLAEKKELFIKFYISSIIINSAILSIIAVLYYLPWLKLAPPADGMNLFYPTFGHNRLADFLIFTIPLLLVLVTTAMQQYRRTVYSILLMFLFLMMAVSFGRGASLSLALSLFIYVMVFRFRPFSKVKSLVRQEVWYKWIIIIVAVICLFLVSNFIYSNSVYIPRYNQEMFPKLYKPAAGELRFLYLKQALYQLQTSPIIGTGLDTFRYFSRRYPQYFTPGSDYTHNHFVQVLAETGIFGGLIFSLLIILLIRQAVKNVRNQKEKNPVYHAILISLLASSIHSLMDYDWQHLSIFLLIFFGFALVHSPFPSLKINKINLIYLYFIFITAFIIKIGFLVDSKVLKAKAVSLHDKGYNQEALKYLKKACLIDLINEDITREVANTYRSLGDYPKARFWLYQAIIRNQNQSIFLLRDDYLLYWEEIEQTLHSADYPTVVTMLTKLKRTYPELIRKNLENVNPDNLQKEMFSEDNIITIKLTRRFIDGVKTNFDRYFPSDEEQQQQLEFIRNTIGDHMVCPN